MQEFFEGKIKADSPRAKDLGVDERELIAMLTAAKNKEDAKKDALLHYVGKKAIGRLGKCAHWGAGWRQDRARPPASPGADRCARE